jgi:hypothetical protein
MSRVMAYSESRRCWCSPSMFMEGGMRPSHCSVHGFLREIGGRVMTQIRIMYGCYIIAIAAWLFALAAWRQALSQEHHHPPQDAAMHDRFYSSWLIPNGGQQRKSSCCDRKDCYRTQGKFHAGQWWALRREDQNWVLLPNNKLEHNQPDPRESPDGQTHVCMSPPPTSTIYCAVLGSDG